MKIFKANRTANIVDSIGCSIIMAISALNWRNS